MKNIKWITSVCMLALPLLVMSSCAKDDEHITYGLELSESSYVFPVDGGTLKVTVNNTFTEGWEATFDESKEWLSETERTENSITFTAAPNSAGAVIPALKVTFTAGEVTRELTLSQDSGISASNYFPVLGGIYSISHNGRYILTAKISELTGLIEELHTIDTETNEMTLATALGEVSDAYSFGGAYGISDDGKTIVYNMNNGGIYEWIVCKDGKKVEIVVPAGGYVEPHILGMTPDASIMVGSVTLLNEAEPWNNKIEPVKWTNGVPEILERPEFERIASEYESLRAEAVGISSDGTLIVGNNGGVGVDEAFFWDENGDWQWPGPVESEEKPGMFGPTMQYFYAKGTGCTISDNGKYMAIPYQAWGMGIRGEGKVNVPALYNIETGEFEFIASDVVVDSPLGGQNVSATNDGGLFYYTLDPAETSYYWQGGSAELAQVYVEELLGGMYVGTNVRISKIVEETGLVIGSFQTLTLRQEAFYVKNQDIQ